MKKLLDRVMMKFSDFMFHYGLLIILPLLALLIASAFVGISQDIEKHKRLMRQCLEDGHKEYKCESMLKSNSDSTIIMPVR